MTSTRLFLGPPTLFSVLVIVGAIPGPVITAAPRLEKRYDAYGRSDFIGYFSTDRASSYNYLQCYGTQYGEIRTHGDWYGGCWYSDMASYFTTCSDNTAYGLFVSPYGTSTTSFYSSQSCTYPCVYDLMVYTPGYSSTSYFVECPAWSRDEVMTLYRTSLAVLPEITVASTSLDSTTTLESSSFSTTPTPTPTTASATAHTQTTPGPQTTTPVSPTATSTPQKKAPIAAIVGGVLGSILFLVLASALGFFLWWKKRRDAAANPSAGHAQPVHMSGDGGASAGGAAVVGGGYYGAPPEKSAAAITIPATMSPPPIYATQQG
ncbi:hypothetical protein BU16DRAFT_544822 [Lophium mytilinum]|uniref:WSC domain-containing protein n=1 Tax=Lophium mytilinum TaxID=390894 RepID=A0A6A6QCP9_9PEZI|nr:hypothetical protein BU16DRAFT_544822 [Lophium mytilinum]